MAKMLEEMKWGSDMRLERRYAMLLALLGVLMILGSSYAYYRRTHTAEKTVYHEPGSAAFQDQDTALLAIYLTGAIQHPGVVKLTPGTCILDAVNAAGGVTPAADMNKINLAQPLADGMRIDVPYKDQAVPNGSMGKVNINTADKKELDKLPGVGPVQAQRILDYRMQHGSFQSLEELRHVRGIGPAKFEKLKGKVTL